MPPSFMYFEAQIATMTIPRKPLLISIITIAGIVFGFIYLLKSCLAKYDERFIKTPALVFTKEDKTVVFTLVEFQKTTSYSQKGGMVSKGVNTQYYIQANDGQTAEFISDRKIKGHRDIKTFPVEILGGSGHLAWVFIGEPMAFDAFTLETKASISILEEKNPALKSKFPRERKFYRFNTADQQLYFTANDGSKWVLDTKTMIAKAAGNKEMLNAHQQALQQLERETKIIDTRMDSLYQQKNIRPSRAYSAQKMSYDAYRKLQDEYFRETKMLRAIKDSLDEEARKLEKNKRAIEQKERDIENLQRSSPSFSQTKINQDTTNGKWFGIYSDEEFSKLTNRVYLQTVYDETARRQVYSSSYAPSKYGDPLFGKEEAKTITTTSFLDAGLLLDKRTASPIHPAGVHTYLIVHKDVVGNEGNVQVTQMDESGKTAWTFNTKLHQWNDWVWSGKYLYIFGINNKNLSGSESNILICLDPATGKSTGFDYFTNKKLN